MTGSLVAARPRLKSDVYFVPAVDGVVLRSSAAQTVIKGADAFAWVERLAPHLDGRATVGQLFATLPDPAREMAEGLVRALLDGGYAKDLALDLPHGLSPEDTQTYAAEITFVDSFRDSAERRFERFRDCRPLLVGSGATFAALVHACLHAGARDVCAVIVGTEPGVDSDSHLRLEERIVEYGRRARVRDPRQTLRVQHLDPTDLDGLGRLLRGAGAGAGAVLSVTDRPMPALAQALARHCDLAGATLVQAITAGDEAWIGPVQTSSSAAGWEDAWLRLRSHPAADLAVESTEPSPYLAGPTAVLVANHLCFLAFKHLTGIDDDTAPATVMRIDLATLDSEPHLVQPHPATGTPAVPSAEALLATVRRLETTPAIAPEEFSRRVVGCLDDRLGLLRDLGEDHFEQVPLCVSRVAVADVTGRLGADDPPAVAYGAGADVATSRRRAVLRGLAMYAAGLEGLGGRSAEYGYDLLDRSAAPVPAGPSSGPAAGSTGGLGSGLDWDEAVCAGLLDRCREYIVAEVASARSECPLVDLAGMPLDGEAASCREQLRIAGRVVTGYRVDSRLAVPAVAICLDGIAAAYGCGLDLAGAVGDGLARALLAHQADTHQQPAYRPPPVPDLPGARRGRAPVEPAAVEPAAVEPAARRLAARRLAAALRTAGRRALVVPLDGDRALAETMPFLIRVVTTDV
jgi:hypothetical protein